MGYIEQNKREFEICGILRWHEKGYTGKGIRMAELESARPDIWFFDGKLHDPFGYGANTGLNTHGQKVLDVMHQVAPDADLYVLPNAHIISGGNVSGTLIDISLPYIINNGIHIVGASLGGTNLPALNEKILEAQKYGIIFVTSAGNEGEKGLSGYAKSNVWISVGAVGTNESRKDIFLKTYSSRGLELDIVCFSGLYVHDGRPGYKDRVFQQEGTSFSQPMAAGMMALVQQFFLEKAGRTLYQDEMETFIRDHVIDLGEEGFDESYGHGLFVLPEPESIDVWKYVGKEDKPEVNNPEYIIIHHSATKQGDAETFRKAHKAKGWRDIGYHYVIGNGTYSGDGEIETGRAETEEGAHAKGYNTKSIGVCLVGNFDVTKPTAAQWVSLKSLCRAIMARYNIPPLGILGHGEVAATNCPGKNLDVSKLIMEVSEVDKTDYKGHWAESAIEAVKAAGIMSGYPDGTFRPDQSVTRAELAAVVWKLIERGIAK